MGITVQDLIYFVRDLDPDLDMELENFPDLQLGAYVEKVVLVPANPVTVSFVLRPPDPPAIHPNGRPAPPLPRLDECY